MKMKIALYILLLWITPSLIFTYTGHSVSLIPALRNVTQDALFFKHQVDALFPSELKRLIEFGLSDNMTILDLGCGPAYFSAELLNIFENIHITCVDIDDGFLEYGKKVHKKRILEKRLNIVKASAFQLPFEENQFDFVISRFLFQVKNV